MRTRNDPDNRDEIKAAVQNAAALALSRKNEPRRAEGSQRARSAQDERPARARSPALEGASNADHSWRLNPGSRCP